MRSGHPTGRCIGLTPIVVWVSTGSEPERRVFLHEVLGEWVRSKTPLVSIHDLGSLMFPSDFCQ